MPTAPEQSSSTIPPRASRVDRLCEFLTRSQEADSDLLCEFVREFLGKVPRQLLEERSLKELGLLVRGSLRFHERADPERVNVEVVNPDREGWSRAITLIRVELRDRPFIVDTIREYLTSENLPIEHYVYRVVATERDGKGKVTRLLDPSEGDARSLVHCEVPRIESGERRDEIRRGIEERLTDVVVATDDFNAMLEAAERAAERVGGYASLFPERAAEFAEIQEFLCWLRDGHFIFLGYRGYDLVGRGGEQLLQVESQSGLGILRHEDESMWAEGRLLSELPDGLRRRVLEGPLLITSKTNAESTVHRQGRMDYIGIKKLGPTGAITGEERFLGLFTSKAYGESAETIPILRHKLDAVLSESGALPASHDYKEIITIFNSMPKEDLFQASAVELNTDVQTVLDLLYSDEVHVTLRPDPLGRGVSVMIILPRGKFSGEIRHRIQESLTRRFGGEILNYHLAMAAGDQARLHFHVSSDAGSVGRGEADDIALEISQIIRSWDDLFLDELIRALGASEGNRLAAAFGDAFPEEYRSAFAPGVAVQDMEVFERLRRDGQSVAITVQEWRGRSRPESFRDASVLKLYLAGERLILSDFMPILDNAGIRVIEVTPFSIGGDELPERMIYSFAVQDPEGGPIPPGRTSILSDALLAIRAGETPNDPFNALVLRAALLWREVDIIRLYANYAFQAGLAPTRFGSARALTRYPELARLLVDLFVTRFAPDEPTRARKDRLEGIHSAVTGALDKVTTLADDRVIRRFVALIEATMRTNYFQRGAEQPNFRSGGVAYISIKIRAADVEELRRTKLLYEIFVYSSRMEGIHLRGAAVSRGGIRWSDRHDDFRTEVLGLVQTQIVKNAVIVPSGSKGGFITKRILPEREAMMEEAAEQYRTLMRGMLDLTDNIVDGKILPPAGVLRYDEDDPYLVVAADKGTAHLSDVANAVAAEYGFWLGDAFASGGSQGYDHKKQGITARGGWECVKRHFREMGKDIQAEPFTAAGIGDMSGDVFGNGMLLSQETQLVAAFDHRHIFIDPTPDAGVSFAERERLFALPRSSWEEYDRSRLSAGAMIVARASKEIQLTPEAASVLGLPEGITYLDGEGLVKAVLKAPVELLWNGGIGTYVKAAEESHGEAGDTTNDAVRIDAQELRCAVIGEGGNLGLTQRARITFAMRGGRLNTDALDNSGGVDMSDHEVNLKILLAPLVAAGTMSFEERNALLDGMTDEVSALVLRDNIDQSLAVSLDAVRSQQGLSDFASLIASLERERALDRQAEGVPGVDELEERGRDGIGLTRPTLCVLLAYAKLRSQAEILDSDLPDEAAAESYLVNYFPEKAVETAGIDLVRQHRLRREIIATQVSNELINVMGATFLDRISRETGLDGGTAAAAWYVADRIAGAAEARRELQELEKAHPVEIVYGWHLGLSRVLERTTRWVLLNVDAEAPLSKMVDDLLAGLSDLRREFEHFVTGEDRVLFEERMGELTELGVESVLASRLVTLHFLPELLDILRIAGESSTEPLGTAQTYYTVGERLGLTWLQQALRSVSSDEPWDKRLARSLAADVQRAHRAISRDVLSCRKKDEPMDRCLEQYEARKGREIGSYQTLVAELRASEKLPLAAVSVAVRALMALAA